MSLKVMHRLHFYFLLAPESILIIAFSRNHKVRAGADVGNAWHIFLLPTEMVPPWELVPNAAYSAYRERR